mgnify:CR=1 FL=1
MSDIRVNTISDSAGTGPVDLHKQSAAKAYQFTDTDSVIIVLVESFNVSSITDASSGQLNVNYTNAFADANFIEIASMQLSVGTGSGAFLPSVVTTATRTASKSRIDANQQGTGNFGRQLSTAVFGDLA